MIPPMLWFLRGNPNPRRTQTWFDCTSGSGRPSKAEMSLQCLHFFPVFGEEPVVQKGQIPDLHAFGQVKEASQVTPAAIRAAAGARPLGVTVPVDAVIVGDLVAGADLPQS